MRRRCSAELRRRRRLPLMAQAPEQQDRVRLVVVFGGKSAEHEISCISASHVLRAADPDKYEIVAVGITQSGDWVAAEKASEFPESIPALGSSIEPLEAIRPSSPAGTDLRTVVFPILHGPNGEDGTIQGMLELAGVPYVGSGVLGSSVAMDKAMAKTVLHAAGLSQAKWITFRHHEADDVHAEEIFKDLGPVVFVKPANMGSSIGISKVTSPDDLPAAVAEAFRYDDTIVIEEGVDARELECAVLGNDTPRASRVGEIVSTAEFYDYTDKYFDGTCETVVPADLTDSQSEELRAMALEAFKALRCSGMARVDMFLRGSEVLVNEVNTIPGFTPISMYPQMWEATGLPYSELIDELVSLAIERFDRRSAQQVTPT